MLILYFILSFSLGLFIGQIVPQIIPKIKSKKNNVSEKYLRRGILQHGFKSGSRSISTQFEIGEIERTGTKSKIEVIHTVCDIGEFNSEYYKNQQKGLINLTWIESSKVEWIEDDISEKRNQKINDILK